MTAVLPVPSSQTRVYNKVDLVTPADGADLPRLAEALWIGVGGTLSFDNGEGTTLATTVPAGLFPCRVGRVRATGTAATGILALIG